MDFTKLFADIPSVISTVDSLVVAFEQKGNGEAKKQAVLNSLGSLYDIASAEFDGVLPSKAQVLQFAHVTVDTVVALKNSTGEFAKGVVEEIKKDTVSVVSEVKNDVEHVVQEVKQEVEHIVHPQV